MTITLDDKISKSLSEGMNTGSGVELPFPVVYLWAMNGQTAYKQQGGAPYFGGWACKAEQMDDMLTKTGLNLPAKWVKSTNAARDGSEFEIYSSRDVIVAPITKRISWVRDENGRSVRHPHYIEGGRQHVQVLAYLAEQMENKEFHPWGTVVLTAKGFQAINLDKAFKDWKKVTAQLRAKIAPGIPAWCFYLAVGTFGKERVQESVGKAAKSPITPLTLYAPDGMREGHLERLFVGEGVAAIMATRKDEAAEWLNEWKKNGNGAADEVEAENGDVQPPDNNFDEAPF